MAATKVIEARTVTSAIQAQGASDPGRVREQNQDVFAVRPELGLVVLADGMGGASAGGVAAEIAVDAALEHLIAARKRGPLVPAALADALKLANERVVGMAAAISSYKGMGTTLVVLSVDGARGHVAHVGDSRAYKFRDGAFTQITRDHSLVQEWVDTGVIAPEEARNAPNRNIITRAIGAKSSLEPEVTEVDIAPNDMLLLCSDGLTGMLTDNQIEWHLRAATKDAEWDLSALASELVDAANQAGGMDNVTVALACC